MRSKNKNEIIAPICGNDYAITLEQHQKLLSNLFDDRISNLKAGEIGLVSLTESGEIVQLGMTREQQISLQLFMAALTKDKPFVRLPEHYNLTFKSNKNANRQTETISSSKGI